MSLVIGTKILGTGIIGIIVFGRAGKIFWKLGSFF